MAVNSYHHPVPPQAHTPGIAPSPYPRTDSYPGSFPAGYLPGTVASANGHGVLPGPFIGVNQTRQRPDPPSTLHPDLMSPLSSVASTGTPSPTTRGGLTRDVQIEKLTSNFRRKNKKIGVFHDRAHKEKSDSIVRRLNDLLSGGVCIIQGFEILPQTSDWLQRALAGGVDYFIFVGLPQSSAAPNKPTLYISEAAFFDVRKYVQRVAEVVVVISSQSESRYARNPHYLDRFLRLECDDMDKVAEDALALFAAPRPKPFEVDNAYFSEVPKLITITKKSGKSLGLSIMTREMSPDSEFPRIVLIKSFGSDCVDEVKQKLGKYTHIQSYNGVFLDGMGIKDVTKIFQSTKSTLVYLTVRYIHPIPTATPTQGQGPRNTPIKKPAAPRLNVQQEELPIPLYILGDIHRYSRKLFDLLMMEEAHSPVSDSSSSSVAAATPSSDVSGQICTPLDEIADSVASLGTVARDIQDRANSRPFSRVLSQSDEALHRAMTSSQIFEDIPPLTFARTPSYPGNGVQQNPLSRQNSHVPQTGKKRYILQLPQKKLDRRFTHIFFRRSGLYLITVGLVEMMGDPLIQFENLCYWLRQVQTYVGPENVKRIVIVGVHETLAGDHVRQRKIDSFVMKLERAVREADFKQIMEISRERLIISFNLNTPQESKKLLCQCINNCMAVMIERVFYYEEKTGFYQHTFEPFTQLSSVASKVSGIKAIVATSKDLEECYNYSDEHYRETLAHYSQACISTEGNYHLIRPSFLIELLLSMEMNSHNYMIHATNITALKKLPVVNAPFPKQQMRTLVAEKREFRQLIPDEQEAILEWAEKLELIYSLGKNKEHMLYFIPFLATESLGDQANYDWDPEEAKLFQADEITVLYAEMHIPTSYQFFYGLIAELLKDVVTEHNLQKSGRCCINLGCKEAILPLHYIDERLNSRVFRVYLQYHPLQNIIEFRAKIVKQQLTFLKTVENKLKGALGNSKSYGGSGENFSVAVSFTLPSPSHSAKLMDSALWVLGEPVKYSREDGELDEEDFDELVDMRGTDLLKTRFMTPDVQREWASSAPEMKEIPVDKFLSWSKKLGSTGDKWCLVGSVLGLITTDDIQYYKENPTKGGNGALLLSRWIDSDCSYKDLIAALRGDNVRLDTLAKQIEDHFSPE